MLVAGLSDWNIRTHLLHTWSDILLICLFDYAKTLFSDFVRYHFGGVVLRRTGSSGSLGYLVLRLIWFVGVPKPSHQIKGGIHENSK